MLCPSWKFSVAPLILSCLAATTACGRRVDPRDRGAPTKEANASPVSRATVELRPSGKTVRNASELRRVDADELFATIRGQKRRGAVVNMWATWCGPCQDELPMLAKVARLYRSRGIDVIPLSVDDVEEESKIPKVLAEYGFEPPYYVVRGSIEVMKAALNPGWRGNVPVSFLLDGLARRRYFFNAEVYEQELVPKLDALLSGTLTDGTSNFGVSPGQEM